MQLEVIGRERIGLVEGLIADVSRGAPVDGLSIDDGEALRLAVAYERENGREVSGDGAVMAAARMIDNVFDADDGPYDTARLMVADLAFQRHAAEVLAAADRYAADGTEPKGILGDDPRIIEIVVKEDLQSDPEVRADWTAIAEGRFHNVSRMSMPMLEESVKEGMGLDPKAGEWLYDNERREDEPDLGSRFGRGIDVLDMADDEEMRRETALQELGSSWQEHVAGEPGYDFLSAEEQDRAREDWFEKARRDLGMPEDEIAALRAESERGNRADGAWESLETIGRRRYDEMMRECRDPSLLVEDIEHHQGKGWDFRAPQMREVPDLLRGMMARGDERLASFSASVAHEMLDDLGASASGAAGWMFDERPAGTFADAYAKAVGGGERTGGMDRAVEEALSSGPAGADRFDERRLEAATGPEAGGFQPFRPATSAEMGRAEEEVSSVVQAIAFDDRTIPVDPSLERAVRLLNASGMEIGGERTDAVTRAFARAQAREASKGPMSTNEKARMIVFDVATQEEARGMVTSNAGGVMNAARGAAIEKPARDMLTSMGIRTLQQEGLSDSDLGYAAQGRFHMLEEYHRAGLDLGMGWASAPSMPEIDRRMERLAAPSVDLGRFGPEPGIVGETQRAGDFAAALDRAASKGPEVRRAPPPIRSKGPSEPGADYASFMAGRGGDKGR